MTKEQRKQLWDAYFWLTEEHDAQFNKASQEWTAIKLEITYYLPNGSEANATVFRHL